MYNRKFELGSIHDGILELGLMYKSDFEKVRKTFYFLSFWNLY